MLVLVVFINSVVPARRGASCRYARSHHYTNYASHDDTMGIIYIEEPTNKPMSNTAKDRFRKRNYSKEEEVSPATTEIVRVVKEVKVEEEDSEVFTNVEELIKDLDEEESTEKDD